MFFYFNFSFFYLFSLLFFCSISALFDGMRAISESQNNIKHKIKKGIDDLKQWLKGHNEYFNHLEHVTQLPNAYEGFLWEIVRRQAFHQLYQNKITAVCEEINRLRAQETAYVLNLYFIILINSLSTSLTLSFSFFFFFLSFHFFDVWID